ncbi:MAG: dephospho-CoA kinase [Fibrobacterota bacterium]
MIIGVTGNIASGKSTVVGLLRDLAHAAVVDADAIGHYLRETNPEIQRGLVSEFGTDILDENGRVSRKKLGDTVFSAVENLSRLNAIFFPFMIYEVKMEMTRAQRVVNHIILDAALILEWGMRSTVDALIVVTATHETRLRRLMENRRMFEEEAELRIASQADEKFKIENADILIPNNGSLEKLSADVEKAAQTLGFIE